MTKTINQYVLEWTTNSEIDPFGVILTDPEYQGGKWQLHEFFNTGEEEINRLFDFMNSLEIKIPSGVFLDFGCGAGRLSKSLRKRFMQGYGIDISEPMIQLAQEYVPEVSFILNQRDNLSVLADNSIDFLYSNIVLQHVNNVLQKKYIEEFLRVLKPGGLAVFQVPTAVIFPTGVLGIWVSIKQTMVQKLRFLKSIIKKTPSRDPRIIIEMHWLPHEEIEQICIHQKSRIECVIATNSTETDHRGRIEFYDLAEEISKLRKQHCKSLLSCMYFIRKPQLI